MTAGPPARLVFALQPSGGTGGSAWAAQPVVAVRDAGGNPTGATVPVTLALGSNPGSGTLSCATGLAHDTVNGTVAFGGCAVDRAAVGYTLLATAPGLATAASAVFDVVVGAPDRLGLRGPAVGRRRRLDVVHAARRRDRGRGRQPRPGRLDAGEPRARRRRRGRALVRAAAPR